MKRITKAEDAYFFAGSIIACNPTTPYYGNTERSRLDSKVIFAKVDSTATEWIGNDIGLNMCIFQKAGSVSMTTALTKHALKEYGNGYLDVRHATTNEVKLLKDLVENNKAELAAKNKEETIKILTDYLANKIPPHPYVCLPIKTGKATNWTKIDPYNEFQKPT